jgi:hypothetical protein
MLDASGIVHVEDDLYLVAEDEVDVLRYFVLDSDNRIFKANGEVINLGENESDFESLAYDPLSQRYFCIGSHGQDFSQKLISFQHGYDDEVTIPFEANRLVDGANIESLTVWKSHLLMGYRSPSRNDLALAVVYDTKSDAQLMASFDLGKRVFRDMTRINDTNYLILAGPERGKHYEKLPSRIYWWNGELFSPQLQLIDLDLNGFRAEGIAVRLYENNNIEVLIGSDESRSKRPNSFRMLYVHTSGIQDLLENSQRSIELSVQL